MKVGTLRELNAKPGDVVKDHQGYYADVVMHYGKICVMYPHWDRPSEHNEYPAYSIVSRINPEPKRETVTLYCDGVNPGKDPMHIGTIDLIDGKPDCDSIRMEPI